MIAIIDFGSQYTALIARRLRESGFLATLFPPDVSYETVHHAHGFILSGGPQSVKNKTLAGCDDRILTAAKPILGICYGLQLLMHHHGGDVMTDHTSEYGASELTHTKTALFRDIPETSAVWMSHADSIQMLPDAFHAIGKTASCAYAAVSHKVKPWYGIQFHPEVGHTAYGAQLLGNFARLCQCPATWTPDSVIETRVQYIQETVGSGRVLCALSGGVDSAVAAMLIHRAIGGDKLTCMFIDHGFMRDKEAEAVKAVFDKLAIRVIYCDASETFLSALGETTDPEKKRHIIGETFIRVFEREAARLSGTHQYLAQGTLYSDVIESAKGAIKSHHNVGGLPEKIGFTLVEPLRTLFKDEVRKVGRELGMPASLIDRQPFPGPGLAIRIINQVITRDKIKLLQQADAIVLDEVRKAGLYYDLWQSFAVLTPMQTVGVQGDRRTYKHTIALRFVTSDDAMTAQWAPVPYSLLSAISTRICNELVAVNRVVYDITSKPPATIEWE